MFSDCVSPMGWAAFHEETEVAMPCVGDTIVLGAPSVAPSVLNTYPHSSCDTDEQYAYSLERAKSNSEEARNNRNLKNQGKSHWSGPKISTVSEENILPDAEAENTRKPTENISTAFVGSVCTKTETISAVKKVTRDVSSCKQKTNNSSDDLSETGNPIVSNESTCMLKRCNVLSSLSQEGISPETASQDNEIVYVTVDGILHQILINRKKMELVLLSYLFS